MWVKNVYYQKFNSTGILGRLFKVTVISKIIGNGEGEGEEDLVR